MSTSICSECHMSAGAHKLSCSHAQRLTKKLSECPYCKRPADEHGGINHVGGCTGLQDVPMNRLQYDILQAEITQLRGNLSLAEEGLAAATQEIEHLKAYQLQMNEILKENAQLRNDLTAVGLERDRLRAALRKLTNEVRGVVSLAGAEIREGAGNTNFSVLRLRTLEAMKILEGASPEPVSPQAPIAKITIRESGAGHYAPDDVSVSLYAPGLPPGEHDLYCEPMSVAPALKAPITAEYIKARLKDPVVQQRLSLGVELGKSLKALTHHELVDYSLDHFTDLQPHELVIIAELYSRIWPGWEQEPIVGEDAAEKSGLEHLDAILNKAAASGKKMLLQLGERIGGPELPPCPHPKVVCQLCGVTVKSEAEPCEHLRSELLAEKQSAEPPFEMRKCLDCTKIFRKRLAKRTNEQS